MGLRTQWNKSLYHKVASLLRKYIMMARSIITIFSGQSLNLENKLPQLIFHHMKAEYECQYVLLNIALLAFVLAFYGIIYLSESGV